MCVVEVTYIYMCVCVCVCVCVYIYIYKTSIKCMRTVGVLSKKQRYFFPKLNLHGVWIIKKNIVSFSL